MGQPVTSTHGAASHSTFYPLLCKHTFLASCKVCTYINQFKAFTAFKTMTNSIKFTTGAFLFVSQFKSDKAELKVASPLKWTVCEFLLKWTDCKLLLKWTNCELLSKWTDWRKEASNQFCGRPPQTARKLLASIWAHHYQPIIRFPLIEHFVGLLLQ